MGPALRVTPCDAVYHVLNRANGREALFDDEGNDAAFEHVLGEEKEDKLTLVQNQLFVTPLTSSLEPQRNHKDIR